MFSHLSIREIVDVIDIVTISWLIDNTNVTNFNHNQTILIQKGLPATLVLTAMLYWQLDHTRITSNVHNSLTKNKSLSCQLFLGLSSTCTSRKHDMHK